MSEKSINNSTHFNFRQGNKEALAEMFCLYFPDLFKYGCKICDNQDTVKDTIQELFIDLWQQKNTLPPIQSIKAYLIKALKYKLLKVINKDKKIVSIEDKNPYAFEVSHESFIISSEEDQQKVFKLMKALEKLPNRQREIIYLKFFLNLGYEEICDIMQIQYQVARNQISQAIKNLKQLVGSQIIWFLFNQL